MADLALCLIPPHYMSNLQLPFNIQNHLEKSAFQALENQFLSLTPLLLPEKSIPSLPSCYSLCMNQDFFLVSTEDIFLD